MNGLAPGQVWWADPDTVRPVVILTRSRVAPLLARVLVAPITTTVRGLATEVRLGPSEGLDEDCVASLDNAQLVPISRLLRPAGKVSGARWPEFCAAMSKTSPAEGPSATRRAHAGNLIARAGYEEVRGA